MAVSRLPAFGGHTLPATRIQTVRTAAVVAVDVDTIVLTAPSLPAHNNPVVVETTIELDEVGGVGHLLTFKLFRNGVEILVADQYDSDIATGITVSFALHWTDETPGANPIYSVRVTSAPVGVNAQNRRLTVSH